MSEILYPGGAYHQGEIFQIPVQTTFDEPAEFHAVVNAYAAAFPGNENLDVVFLVVADLYQGQVCRCKMFLCNLDYCFLVNHSL